jgi:uncharacterized protein (TIGR03435 family)
MTIRRALRWAVATFVTASVAGVLKPQSDPSPFEAVSLTPHQSITSISGNQFTEEAATLQDLIAHAYHVQPFQISALPTWPGVYDISSRVTPGRTPTPDQVRHLLQTVLADRFHLRLHHQTKTISAYALVLANRPSKLTRCEASSAGGKGGRTEQRVAPQPSWDRIPTVLSLLLNRPVIDKTGFEGHYCALYGQDPLAALDPTAASIFTEIEEKWALKLQPETGPVDILVIDHVERPSAN